MAKRKHAKLVVKVVPLWGSPEAISKARAEYDRITSPEYWIAKLESAATKVRDNPKSKPIELQSAAELLNQLVGLRMSIEFGEWQKAINPAVRAGMLAERMKLGGVIEANAKIMDAGKTANENRERQHQSELTIFCGHITRIREMNPCVTHGMLRKQISKLMRKWFKDDGNGNKVPRDMPESTYFDWLAKCNQPADSDSLRR